MYVFFSVHLFAQCTHVQIHILIVCACCVFALVLDLVLHETRGVCMCVYIYIIHLFFLFTYILFRRSLPQAL